MTLAAGASGWVEWAATGTPIPGETSSGDGHLVVQGALRTLIAVMDGLGHGPEAHRATTAAIAAIAEIPDAPLRSLFKHCDGALRHTRGVVMTIASIAGDGQMEWMGVGNVEAIVVRSAAPYRHEAVVTRGGVVGYRLPSLYLGGIQLDAGDVLVMATDGIPERLCQLRGPDPGPADHRLAHPRRAWPRLRRRAGLRRPLRGQPAMRSGPPADLDYAASLRAYLEEPGESALAAAYELGRAAMDSGAGVIDIVGVHAEALGGILDGSAADAISARSIPFLVECLAPLEMAHRGFMEASRTLQGANADLELRTSQLQEANKDLESFAYSVSHDLRAPLRAIDGFSQTVLEDFAPVLDDAGRFAIERIRANAIRMGRLIDDMLHLARISHGELSPGPTDLGALARQIVAELREQQPDRDLDVRIAGGLVADADPDFMRIALANLLSNAFKFTGNQTAPRIDFASETQGDEVVYYVRDNGAGFDMAYADQIFRPFERLHSQDEFPGTGIGLATVQRVIRRHGGRIWADAAIGRGATVFFTLNSRGSGTGTEH